MEKQTPKSDESVKTGLEIEGNNTPEMNKENDADELVHEQNAEQPDSTVEHDADELVHQQPDNKTVDTNEETDIDDLMHEADNGDDDRR